MKRAKRAYKSLKIQRQLFDKASEEFTAKYSILIGIERLGGYRDNKGEFVPPAFSLHVDGLVFRVETITHGIAFLQGVCAGFEFSASRSGIGFLTRTECEDICRKIINESRGEK